MSARTTIDTLVWCLLAAAVCSCASGPQRDGSQPARSNLLADTIPTWAGGEPAKAPKRPSTAAAYPPVFEIEQPRRPALLTDEEYKAVREDLIAARESARARANETSTAAPTGNANPASAASQVSAAREQRTATAAN